MKVTDVRIRNVNTEGKLKAYVTVTFDDCFVLHNVKIIEGKTGLFIAMPSRKVRSGENKDVGHPISPEFRAEMQRDILAAYEKTLEAEKGEI
ncbi:septation regulator SpoVG [Treponema phagedenis]|uniref:Putative septation protein SpoVG n=1 Tax=Treponema phagedenis TaxID=162 RepID=A0A0B7GSD7_TREPH|nr:septation regulator SpoVG [Treponema phagedenis]EFW38638.1 putative stage V sporulation protein G [Treponema phagedenis F0421]NVP25083.1 septation regulator SpoVG [Treponema phagedenis]QEJ95767.1 septation regulator SpoVG [Treponema phagedenis]QEJ97197.1 septation regulator SpoVG [Treponema phagedenis]QEK00311.1 septation regulator SpoVG [Treponema phagedenis]